MSTLFVSSWASATVADLCVDQLNVMPGAVDRTEVAAVCGRVQELPHCASVKGTPLYVFERPGSSPHPQRILATALIHGDEKWAGSVARAWMLRLSKIAPRNTWRVIPMVNPDGWRAKTRNNAHGVDLNRNFPTANWQSEALPYWKEKMKSDPRRFPGPQSASEPETQCLLKELAEFKPDFVVSIHTPLGVLDLDGPAVKAPDFKALPLKSLGNYPGSLGRYMWVDHHTPVLTIELRGNDGVHRLEDFDRLQDVSGTMAIDAAQKSASPHSFQTSE